MENTEKDVNYLKEQLNIFSKNLEFLRLGHSTKRNMLKLIDFLKKNENFAEDIDIELETYHLTYNFYACRTKEELTIFYEAHGSEYDENMLNDLRRFSQKYNLDLTKIHDFCVELYEENPSIPYIPQMRLENGKLVAGDDEILESIEQEKFFIVHPWAILKLKKISTKHYSNYLDIVQYWIFLNISKLIQVHMGMSALAGDELSAIIVNFISHTQRDISTYRKEAFKHIHEKAHGFYIYTFYGDFYKDDLHILRKLIKIKDKTVKKTSYKNLMNLIELDTEIEEGISWNIGRKPSKKPKANIRLKNYKFLIDSLK